MRIFPFFASVAAAIFLASSAVAAPEGRWVYPAACKEVTKSDSEQGHTLFLAAKVKVDNGKYEGALEDFISAYGKDCSKPVILVWISKTHELNGDRKEAIRAIELYLERNPGAEDATTQRNRMAALQAAIADDGKPKGPVTNSPDAKTPDTKAPDTKSPDAPAPVEPATEPSGNALNTYGPWVAVGAGGAALVTGVVLIATASYPAQCDADTNKCTVPAGTGAQATANSLAADANSARSRKTVGGVLTGVGIAGVGAGLAWYFLTADKSEPAPSAPVSAKVQFAPTFLPGFAGFSAAGTF